jgi:predicted ATPase
LHGQIAYAIERAFPDKAMSEPEVVAHHFTKGGLTGPAISYWLKAGRRALQRSAGVEAIAHLQKGIGVLSALADSPERDRDELALQLDLGLALTTTHGWNAPEVAKAYQRANELVHRLGDDQQSFQALWGLWMAALTGGNYQAARFFNAELFHIARRLNDSDLLLQSHHSAWQTGLWKPELTATTEHIAQGLALYDVDKHRPHAFLYGGHDAGVCGHAVAAGVRWLLGYPDQARRSERQAIDLAEALSHPPSLAHGLLFAGLSAYCRRDVGALLDYSDRVVSIGEEHRLALYVAGARVLCGWARVEQGEVERGLAELRRGIDAYAATNVKLLMPGLRNALAESYLRAGNIEAGLAASQEALDTIAANGEGIWRAEVLRTRGDLLAAAGRYDEAESFFCEAIEVAREQGARSPELRAVTAMARHWRDMGRLGDALDTLAPVYGWFTEGFDTVDLKAAETLLDQLKQR